MIACILLNFFLRLHGISSGGSRNFGRGGFEAQNLKNSDVFTKIESDFSAEIGNSNVFFAQIQVVSKKKKISPDWLRLGRWGGDASRNGAELFETEADFSA